MIGAIFWALGALGVALAVFGQHLQNVELRRRLELRRRSSRILELWAHERRHDLAVAIRIFSQVKFERDRRGATEWVTTQFQLLEGELRKQARYCGLTYGPASKAIDGFRETRELTTSELIELGGLSRGRLGLFVE